MHPHDPYATSAPRAPGDYLTPGGTLIEGGEPDGSDRGLSLGQLDRDTIRDRLARYDAAQAGLDAAEYEHVQDELVAGRAPLLCVAPGQPSAPGQPRGTGAVVRITQTGEVAAVQAIARRAFREDYERGHAGSVSPALRRVQPRPERGTTHRVTRRARRTDRSGW